LILSTFKKTFFFWGALTALWGGCSHEKNLSAPAPLVPPKEVAPQYVLGPLAQSNTFIDKTEQYGLWGVKAVHLYAVDVNHDGHTDLITLDDFYASPKFYFFNKRESRFVLGPSPFDGIVRGSYLNFVDFDHDGFYDVIVGTLNQKTEVAQYPPRLFKGEFVKNQLHYKEQASLPSGKSPTSSLVAFDYDLDGEIDLFLGNWFSYNDLTPRPLPDVLLKGNGFNFSDVSNALKGEYDYSRSTDSYINARPTFGASICDIDKNGFPDILTSSSNGYFNKYWQNHDGKNFVNYGLESGFAADAEGSEQTRGGGNSFFSLCGDYNNDELIDIVVGNLFRDTDPETRDKSSVLTGSSRSNPPRFIRSEFLRDNPREKWSEGDKRGIWIDYNLDGLNDLIIENSGFPPDSRLVFFEQAKNHAFTDQSLKLGINIMNPAGAVTMDLNRDGVMDFIVGQSKTRAGDIEHRLYVFENQTKREARGSVRFHLQGKKSNFHGLSSSVSLTTNKRTRFFNVEYNSGPLASQNEEGAYFAFDKERPRFVTVRWAWALKDRLDRPYPLVKKYDLSNLPLAKAHHELNLCEDGRVLRKENNCD
jgi:hypothetical protein